MGFDRKSLVLTSDQPATITAEFDLDGDDHWVTYQTFKVDGALTHEFPAAFQA